MQITLGKVRIRRIEESLGPGAPIQVLFPQFDAAAFAPHRSWMVPDFLEAGTDCLITSSASWYVETPRSKIIIDTCIGNCKDRPGYPPFAHLRTDYLGELERAGIDRHAIDYVVMTHLHIDHVGWNTTLVEGKWIPTFPNAKYLFSEDDLRAWNPANGPLPNDANLNVFEDSIQPVIDAGLALRWQSALRPDPDVELYLTPGHSPGHCAVKVSGGGQTALFSGDIMHSPVQVVFPLWNSLFCEDAAKAVETRLAVLSDCADHGHLLVPAHWGPPHAAYILRDRTGKGFRVRCHGSSRVLPEDV